MKKSKNIVKVPRSSLFRGVIAIVTLLLVTVKLASPFLHIHQFNESSSQGVIVSSLHCSACDFEATQAIEPGLAIVLPSTHFTYESKILETQSVFVTTIHSSSESRGPPQIS